MTVTLTLNDIDRALSLIEKKTLSNENKACIVICQYSFLPGLQDYAGYCLLRYVTLLQNCAPWFICSLETSQTRSRPG